MAGVAPPGAGWRCLRPHTPCGITTYVPPGAPAPHAAWCGSPLLWQWWIGVWEMWMKWSCEDLIISPPHNNAPSRARTCDLEVNSLTLWPAELWKLGVHVPEGFNKTRHACSSFMPATNRLMGIRQRVPLVKEDFHHMKVSHWQKRKASLAILQPERKLPARA